MILMVIKAAIVTFALWVSYMVGRCTATHDWCDLATGKTKVAPDDIKGFYSAYVKHYGGDQNE